MRSTWRGSSRRPAAKRSACAAATSPAAARIGLDWTGELLLTGDPDRFRQALALPEAGSPRIRSNRPILEFEAGTGFATPATLTLCDRRGARAARAVIVSRSGRPRTSVRDASDRVLTC